MKTKIILSFTLILLVTLACSTEAFPGPQPTAQSVLPSPTIAAVAPANMLLYQQVTLTSLSSEEASHEPDFKITTETPKLTGSDDPRVNTFNDEMTAYVKKSIDEFKQNMTSLGPAPISAQSTLDLRYEQLAPTGNILSIKFTAESYIAGMAHPSHFISTVNFDLEQGKDLILGDLFSANSNYLETIAKYCIAQLSTRDIGFTDVFTQGANPTPENYQNWNITQDGLMITFNEYQVAPYVAGPQTVTVPYTELKSIINQQGPLASFLP